MICMSMVGPAQTETPEWWGFSGELDGQVTMAPVFGSWTRVSTKNCAAPLRAG